MFSRKKFLLVFIFSFILFTFSSVSLFLFNSNAKVTLDSVSSDYVFPSSPDVIKVSGVSFMKPSLFSENSERVATVAPSVFSEGSWSIYPTSLEPGVYYIFSGFSQSSFQIHFSLFDFSNNSMINPLFWIVLIVFLVFSIILFVLLIFLLKNFVKKPLFVSVLAFFVLVVSSISVLAFLNVSSGATAANKTALAPVGSLANFPEFSDSFSLKDSNIKYSLNDLEFFLETCIRSDTNNASMYSNNTACAASVFDYATKTYGPSGFVFLFSSKSSLLFNESCEFASRYSASYVLEDPIDVTKIEEGLVCNFSWLNHLVSSSYTEFDNVYSFLDYSAKLCASIGKVKNITSDIVRQQCSRGIGVGLFNLTRSTVTASSLCANLPFDPQNCTEGVFLEAYNQLSSKKLYGIATASHVSLCEGLDPVFVKGCFRIIDKDLLKSYSISEFKKYCAALGSSYDSACAYTTGHLAGQSIDFNDFKSLNNYCDFTDSFSCLRRFYYTQTVENSAKASEILDSCFTYINKFNEDSKICMDLTNFIKNVVDVKE